MAVRGYAKWNPTGDTAYWFNRAARVLQAYAAEWPLSNRQLFYRMVAEHDYDKTEKAYGKLVDMVARGRRAGLIDWRAIRDGGLGTGQDAQMFDDADDFIDNAARWAKGAQLDRQQGQPQTIELWCEAGGMLPILRSVAQPYGCRANTGGGYDSVTAKHQLACRVRDRARGGLPTVILHVGDFDPSGEDMCSVLREDAGQMAASQVIRAAAADLAEAERGAMDWVPAREATLIERAVSHDEKLTASENLEVWRWATSFLTIERVALTGEQVVERGVITAPPKKTDSRMQGFIERNWETVDALGTEDISAQLEALTPAELRELIREVIEGHMDMDAYRSVLDDEEPFRDELQERLTNA